jgi:lysozyme family protein
MKKGIFTWAEPQSKTPVELALESIGHLSEDETREFFVQLGERLVEQVPVESQFIATEEIDAPMETIALEAKKDEGTDKRFQAVLKKLQGAAGGLKSKLESLANQHIRANITTSGNGYEIHLKSIDPEFKGHAPEYKLKLKAAKD